MLSPNVNIFEYEINNLNPSLDISKIIGVPSLPYNQIAPQYINTNIDKERNVINSLNCNNVHYEICKEDDLDVGLVFEYNKDKKQIIPFTNFKNMIYNATFDETLNVCYIERIKKFYNGNVVGEFIPVYEELSDKFRISVFQYKDYSVNCVTNRWTYEYLTNDLEKIISIKEYVSTDGFNFSLVQEILSTNLLDEIYYEVQARQTYIINNKIVDVNTCVFDYKNRFIGFNKANSEYMRFSLDTDNRVKVISYKKDWMTVIKCNLYYFSDSINQTIENNEFKINCEEYFGVQKQTYNYIEIETDSSKPNINAFSDFKDYGLTFINFSRKHQYINEIRYFNELNILVKKATPIYRPDYLIDTLVFSELSEDGTEFLHSGIINYYYDLNNHLVKVIEYKNNIKIADYTVIRTNDIITSFRNELIPDNSLEIEYKSGTDIINKVLKRNGSDISFWYKTCYSGTNIPGAIYYIDNHTIEVKYFNKCRTPISGVITDEEPINTEKIIIDDYNSLDYVYDYNGPKVERFFINENDWSFIDNAGCQSYLKYIVVKNNGHEYFCIPKYKNNGTVYYVDMYEKISNTKVGNFIKRIEFLNTVGKEEAEYKELYYVLKYANPYIDNDGNYQHSENDYAIVINNYGVKYFKDGYLTDDYIIQVESDYDYIEVFEPCNIDECSEFYWEGAYSNDYEYSTMCRSIIEKDCIYPYVLEGYVLDSSNYILCPDEE